jgi:repressor LexA
MITAYIEKHGYPPTRTNICEGCGFSSPNAAQWHIDKLISAGAIEVDVHVARGIRVLRGD